MLSHFLKIPLLFLTCWALVASLNAEDWYDADVGVVGIAGTSSYDGPSDSFTVQGTGAQIGGAADGAHIVYQHLSGNLEIIAKVISQTNTNGYAKAGITIRESLDEGARHVTLAVTPSYGTSLISRSTTNGATSVTLGSAGVAPVWLRLVRSGTSLAGYQSADGIHWELVGQRTISMLNRLNVGLLVSSYNQGTLGTAVFDHVSAFSSVPQVGSNLKLWLRSDVGLVLDGSNKVSQWTDQSGNGFHAGQSNSSNRPLWVDSGLNGQSVIRFNTAGSTFLSIPDSAALMPSQVNVFAVVKRSSGSGGAVVAEKFHNGNSAGYSIMFNSATAPRSIINGNSINGSLSANTFGLLEQVYNQIENKLAVNGIATTSALTAAIASNSNPFYVGGRGTTNGLDGDIAELLVFDTVLTEAKRQEIQAYFYTKYGIGVSPQLAAPTSNIVTGTYSGLQNIELTGPEGALIYYTTDGSEPTTSSTLYTGSFSVNSTTRIRAIAVKDGYDESIPSDEKITIDSTTSTIARSGLQLWLKADSLAGTGGDPVSLWEDQSGNKVNVTQGTSGNRPTLQTGVINSRPVIRFDGSNDFLQGNVSAVLQPANHTIIAVARRSATTSFPYVISLPYTTSGFAEPLTSWAMAVGGSSTDKVLSRVALNATTSSTISASTALALNTPALVVSSYNGSNHKLYLNGGLDQNSAVAGSIAYGGSTVFNVGSRGVYSNGNYLNGDIAEILFYNRVLTDDERRDIELYIYTKYAVGVQPTTLTPASNVPTGSYAEAQQVSLSSSPGAAIYYTTNGSTPTTSSTLYTGSFSVPTSTTIRAIAVKTGYLDSPLAKFTITIDSATASVSRTGLVGWFNAGAGVTVDGSNKVEQWDDQSGNNHHAVQSTAGNKPTLVASVINGKPAVRFASGSQNYLSIPHHASLMPSQVSMIAVVKRSSGSGNVVVAEKLNNGSNAGYSLQFNNATTPRSKIDGNNANGTLTSNTYGVLEQIYNQTNNTIYVNGGAVSSAYTAAITSTTNPFYLGGRGTSSNLDGDIVELLVYSRALNTAERQDIQAYLRYKYNVGATPALAPAVSSVPQGTYVGSKVVALSAIPGASIYYTTDGSDPTTSSTLYTTPFTISSTTKLKTLVIKDGYGNSAITSALIEIEALSSKVARSGLQLWLKADTLEGSDGSTIATWPDQSGNGRDATQGTSGNRPTLRTSVVNGKPVIRFDGSNDYLSVANAAALNPSQLSIVALVKRLSGTGTVRILSKFNSNLGYRTHFTSGTNVRGEINTVQTNATLASSTWGVVAQVYDQVNNRLYINGVGATPTASTLASGSNTVSLDIGGQSGGNCLNGDIAELLVYDRALTDQERKDIESYAFSKYAIGAEPVTALPTLSPPGGTYASTQYVTLTGLDDTAFYYTTDGNDPTTSSTLYTGPITVSATTTVKAIGLKGGYAVSPVITSQFTIESLTSHVPRSGLQLWLKADSLAGAGGSAVATWVDQSGNARNAVQGTSDQRPTLQTGVLNGLPVLRFDGSNDKMTVADAPALNPSRISVIAVAKRLAGSGNASIIDKTNSNTGYKINFNSATTVQGKINAIEAQLSLTSGNWGMMAHIYDQAYNRLFINGAQGTPVASTDAIATNALPLSIGGLAGSSHLNCDLAEILVYDRALTDQERRDLESYVSQKYAVGFNVQVAAPQASVQGGTFQQNQSVSLTCSESGAAIHYTLDGSPPTSASAVYSYPLMVGSTTTIKAIAIKSGFIDSEAQSWVFTIDPALHLPRADLQVWLKSDNGIEADGSSKVSRWLDQSGNGNHAVQTTGSNQPTLVSSVLNGQPALRFNSSAQTYLAIPDSSSLNPAQVTVFSVAKRSSGSSGARILSKFDSSTGYTTGFNTGTQVRARINAVENTGTQPLGTWAWFTHVYNQISNNLFINGILADSTASTAAITSNTYPVYLGGHGTSNVLDGDIAEVILYSRGLSNSERQQVEYYLNNKYALVVATLASPQFSVAGGTLSSPTQIALSVPEGSVVYYTVDGSTPTASSLLYTGPIPVFYTTTIKAIAVKNGYPSSSVVTATYTLDSGAWPAPVNDPGDTTPPTINLEKPSNAVLQ